jgi:DNA polymerase
MTPEEVRRQVARQLESLALAGVEWLPPAPPLEIVPRQPALALVEVGEVTQSSLFEAPAPPPAPAAGTTLTLQQRRTELQRLAERVAGCTRCAELASTRTQTVFADGQPEVELCFIGEAPGGDEDAQGLPFVGAAGQMLNKIIAACGLKREEVYICNIIKCRPPGNRTPKPDEALNCREYLTRQLELVRPNYICALGGCAAQYLLETGQSVGKLRGKFHDYHGIPVWVTYHPAFILPHRSPERKREVWNDMQQLMKHMGRTIPPRSV